MPAEGRTVAGEARLGIVTGEGNYNVAPEVRASQGSLANLPDFDVDQSTGAWGGAAPVNPPSIHQCASLRDTIDADALPAAPLAEPPIMAEIPMLDSFRRH